MGDMADWCMQYDEEYDDQYDDKPRFPSRSRGPGYCPKCGEETVLREGKYGKFYGCSTFPRCRGTRVYASELVPPPMREVTLDVELFAKVERVDICSRFCPFLRVHHSEEIGPSFPVYSCSIFQVNLIEEKKTIKRYSGCIKSERGIDCDGPERVTCPVCKVWNCTCEDGE